MIMLLTTPRVTVSFGFWTFRLRFNVCHSRDTSLTVDGVKYAFQALRLLAFIHVCMLYTITIHNKHHYCLVLPLPPLVAVRVVVNA